MTTFMDDASQHLMIDVVDPAGNGAVDPAGPHHQACWCGCPHSSDERIVALAAQTRAMARLLVEAGHATPMLTHRMDKMLRDGYGL